MSESLTEMLSKMREEKALANKNGRHPAPVSLDDALFIADEYAAELSRLRAELEKAQKDTSDAELAAGILDARLNTMTARAEAAEKSLAEEKTARERTETDLKDVLEKHGMTQRAFVSERDARQKAEAELAEVRRAHQSSVERFTKAEAELEREKERARLREIDCANTEAECARLRGELEKARTASHTMKGGWCDRNYWKAQADERALRVTEVEAELAKLKNMKEWDDADLARHDAEVRAKALTEAHKAYLDQNASGFVMWLAVERQKAGGVE